MTSLKQQYRALLSEMDTFLVKTLKDVPLNKKATDQKDRLVGKVRLMMDDMSVTPGDNRKSSLLPDDQEEYDDINAPGEEGDSGFSWSQISSDGVAKVPASSLRNKLQSGLLDKKKKSGLKSWEPYYCVVSGNMFYMYKKASDAKQKEAFCLTGYDFQKAPSLDSNRGDMCFELTKPGSIPYQFRAACKDGMLEWRQSILKGVKFVEAYENAHLDGNKSAASQAHKPEDDQEIYDEVGAREAAYYTECASDRPTSDNFYMNQGLYENSNGKTTYDLMGQAPPPPKGTGDKVPQATGDKGAQIRGGKGPQTADDKGPKATGERPKSMVRSSKLPQWPPVKPPDDDDYVNDPQPSPASPDKNAPPPLPGGHPSTRPKMK